MRYIDGKYDVDHRHLDEVINYPIFYLLKFDSSVSSSGESIERWME